MPKPEPVSQPEPAPVPDSTPVHVDGDVFAPPSLVDSSPATDEPVHLPQPAPVPQAPEFSAGEIETEAPAPSLPGDEEFVAVPDEPAPAPEQPLTMPEPATPLTTPEPSASEPLQPEPEMSVEEGGNAATSPGAPPLPVDGLGPVFEEAPSEQPRADAPPLPAEGPGPVFEEAPPVGQPDAPPLPAEPVPDGDAPTEPIAEPVAVEEVPADAPALPQVVETFEEPRPEEARPPSDEAPLPHLDSSEEPEVDGSAPTEPNNEEPAPESQASARPARPLTWGQLAKAQPSRRVERATVRPVAAPAAAWGGVVPAVCEYDRKSRRLVNFQLSDLQGRPVRLSDIDADYILLDFWGTWCGPCIQSIPHLVELQKRYGADRVRVVGIAYEQDGTVRERALKVADAARKLGINYTVLLGNADERPCPVQAALHIQAYPTMILLDRHGRLIWRDQGATEMTLARLNRVIASQTQTDILRR